MLPPKNDVWLCCQNEVVEHWAQLFCGHHNNLWLSYYTNITITVTFVNQVTLCRAFFFFPPKYYLHKSRTIFHIDLYVFNIHTEISNSTNELNHVKRSAVFQNKPFWIPFGRMIHLCRHWNKRMLTIVQSTLCNCRAWWLPLINERFVLNKLVAVSIIFLDLVWQTMLPNLIASVQQGTMVLCMRVVPPASSSSSKINETLLSRKQQSCQKCKHRQSHFNFPNTDSKKISFRVSLLKRNDSLAKLCFA